MTYAWIQDVPINLAIYEQIKAELGDQPPQGLIVHLVAQTEHGLRYVDVWESREAHDRFFEDRVHPALGRVFARVGFQPPAEEPPRQELDVRDIWKP